MRIASSLKQLIAPRGTCVRTIKTGPFRGLPMQLDLTTQSQLYLGLFEREVYPWLTRLSAGIKMAVDIGAAHGEYTLYFLLKTGVERVFVFEPDSRMQLRLKANLGLSGMSENSRLFLSNECVGGMTVNGAITTLDSLLPSFFWPCLIKMDVDGAEMDVLRGAGELLQQPGVRWLIETHSKGLEADCVRILEKAGFQARIVPNAWWRTFLPELRVSEQNRWLVAANDGCLQ